jgi:hypothetical protein
MHRRATRMLRRPTCIVREYDVLANPACLQDVANRTATVIGEPLGLSLAP